MYQLKDIAGFLGLSTRRLPVAEITILLTDSRKLTDPTRSLFFALSGPRRNGHQFIGLLYQSGLRYFVVDQPVDRKKYPGAVFLKVADAGAALQELAACHRQRFDYEVIGITGSNGKTVVKEWLYQLLHKEYRIVRSPKSYNSQIGVPLSVWQMADRHELGIFEAGISQPGEMEKLETVIRPTIGVLTHFGTAHSEGFKSRSQKLTEKLQLFGQARLVIANGDQPSIRKAVQQLPGRIFFWGKSGENHLQLRRVRRQRGGALIHLVYEGRPLELALPLQDAASIENAISCCALLLCMGLSPEFIREAVSRLQPVNMRLAFNRGLHNSVIINDSYSADTDSLSIALDFLTQVGKGLEKTVILSDFMQGGQEPRLIYEEILDQLQRHEVRLLIGIGPHMQELLPQLLSGRKKKLTFRSYRNTQEFLQAFPAMRFKDQAILIKGARVFTFEQIAALLEQKAHQTVLEINLDAIAHNFNAFQQLLAPRTRMMVMVKAFGYGSGGSEIAALLEYRQADYFGVAYADEGVELRQAGIRTPVMVLNPEPAAFDAITDHRLEPDIYGFEQLDDFEQHVQDVGLSAYPIHIELETGMNRLGFDPALVDRLGARLKDQPWLRPQSVFSHLAASEDHRSDAFTRRQYQLFMDAAARLEELLGYPLIKHIANSAAIRRMPELQLDMVRLGIGLYGIGGKAGPTRLLPALTLKTTIAQVKQLPPGATVSYNRRGRIVKESLIATVRIGYADGYSRKLGQGVGYMLVRNKKAPVVGTVCMDMVMIDVTGIKGVRQGDEVLVFGEGLPLEELARKVGTIPYEIMTGISQRVKRVYWSL
ncbi:bifunctional UDP-N-acetylmuramoyl-tripeptide:D-alanyl-D-alanine ligase/alanine racemase [Niabella terrae]